MTSSNENKMSDGGREGASLGMKIWKSSQKSSAQRSAVRSIAWLGLPGSIMFDAMVNVPLPAALQNQTITCEMYDLCTAGPVCRNAKGQMLPV
jgi:hypothetical protein